MDTLREEAIVWLQEWYRDIPDTTPWRVETLFHDEDGDPFRESHPAAGIPVAIRAIIKAEGIGLSMIARSRNKQDGVVRPIGIGEK
jgi:hypothetical protein